MLPTPAYYDFSATTSLVTVLVVFDLPTGEADDEGEIGEAGETDVVALVSTPSSTTGSLLATFPAVQLRSFLPEKNNTGIPNATMNSMIPKAENTVNGPRSWIQPMTWLEKKNEMNMRSDETVTSTGPAHCG